MKITEVDRWKVMGLLELSKDARKTLAGIEKALAQILKQKDEGHGYYGHISDQVYSDEASADELLKLLEIEVE